MPHSLSDLRVVHSSSVMYVRSVHNIILYMRSCACCGFSVLYVHRTAGGETSLCFAACLCISTSNHFNFSVAHFSSFSCQQTDRFCFLGMEGYKIIPKYVDLLQESVGGFIQT